MNVKNLFLTAASTIASVGKRRQSRTTLFGKAYILNDKLYDTGTHPVYKLVHKAS